jgi:hypothetical protein
MRVNVCRKGASSSMINTLPEMDIEVEVRDFKVKAGRV